MSASFCPFCGVIDFEMNKTELKVIISEFNNRSSRLLRAAWDDYMNLLRKFIKYLDTTEIILEYIQSCGGYIAGMDEEIKNACKDYLYYFTLGESEEEEVSTVYTVIKYISQNYQEVPFDLVYSYGQAKKGKDNLKAFNDRFVLALINDISQYLTKVGIQMGMDENVTYNISGNQVNFANDNANINAVQNSNGINADELKNLISAMRKELSQDLSDEDKNDANESIDIIEAELASGHPDEEKVKSNLKLLKRIDGTVKFASACCSLLNFADKMYPFIEQIIPWFQSHI